MTTVTQKLCHEAWQYVPSDSAFYATVASSAASALFHGCVWSYAATFSMVYLAEKSLEVLYPAPAPQAGKIDKGKQPIEKHFHRFTIEDLQAKDKKGNTPLHKGFKEYFYDSQVQVYELLPSIKKLSSKDQLSILLAQNDDKETPMHRGYDKYRFQLEQMTHLLNFVRTLPQEDQLQLFLAQDKDEKTPLHRAWDIVEATYSEIEATQAELLSLISLLPKEFQFEIFAAQNKDGKNLLHLVFRNWHSQSSITVKLLDLIKNLPNEDQLQLFLAQDKDGNTPLHRALENYNFEQKEMEKLLDVIKNLPQENQLQILLAQNKYKRTPLHWAYTDFCVMYYDNTKNVEKLLDFIAEQPEEAQLEILLAQDDRGTLPLEVFIKHRSFPREHITQLITFISNLSPESQSKVFSALYGIGDTLFYCALNNDFPQEQITRLLQIVAQLPKEELSKVCLPIGELETTFLHRAFRQLSFTPEQMNHLLTIFMKLARQDLLQVFLAQNEAAEALLYLAFRYQSEDVIIQLLEFIDSLDQNIKKQILNVDLSDFYKSKEALFERIQENLGIPIELHEAILGINVKPLPHVLVMRQATKVLEYLCPSEED